MAEAAAESSEKEEGVEVRPRIRPPDRKKFEREQEDLNQVVTTKHTELKALPMRPDEAVYQELRSMRKEKEATIGRRKDIDRQLSDINQAIRKQMDSLSKVQGNLPYKNEDRINEAIRRLEHQLRTQNFNVREERKIVSEIDRLKRSKKSLVQYTEIKHDIDAMRDRQRRMREERDRLYRAVTQIKSREEDIKRKHQSVKEQADSIKRDIDDIEEQKRRSFQEFKKQERDYNAIKYENMKKRNEEFRKKLEEERQAQLEEQQKELAEIEAMREPYEEEKQLCLTLITYLHRFLTTEDEPAAATNDFMDDNLESIGSNAVVFVQYIEVRSKDENENAVGAAPTEEQYDGMYMLKKKDEDLFGGLGRQKSAKKNKREKRKTSTKPERPIVHNPEIFAQFASLSLEAPSNLLEVPASITMLQDKKLSLPNSLKSGVKSRMKMYLEQHRQNYFDHLPHPSTKPAIHVEVPPCDASGSGSAGAPSFTESAISESIPSTPEVMLDHPRFPRGDDGAKDSGMELDENNSSDELTPTDDTAFTSMHLANEKSSVIPVTSAVQEPYPPLTRELNLSPNNLGHFPALPKLLIPPSSLVCGEAPTAASNHCDEMEASNSHSNPNKTLAKSHDPHKSHDQAPNIFSPDVLTVTESSSDKVQNYLELDGSCET